MQIISDVETLNRAMTPDEGNSELEGYYCIQTIPHFCTCCFSKPWTFIHHEKKIVVWEDKDDEYILHVASEFKKIGLEPKIVEYKAIYGKCVTWEEVPMGGTVA